MRSATCCGVSVSLQEMLAVLGAPGATWTSQRDHLLLGMLYNTGARVSEIIDVRVGDLMLDGVAYVHLRGKGRKRRTVSLWPSTVREIRAWLRANLPGARITVVAESVVDELAELAEIGRRLEP